MFVLILLVCVLSATKHFLQNASLEYAPTRNVFMDEYT